MNSTTETRFLLAAEDQCLPANADAARIALLRHMYDCMLSAADPMRVLPPCLPPPPSGRTVVVGAGKAAAAMARAVEKNWSGPLSGVVAVPPGAKLPLAIIKQVEGGHPVPNESSLASGRVLMRAVAGLCENDLVLALISGGGSALCALPATGIAFEEKQAITRALLARGATIQELNTVRKHLSAIKGGRLALAAQPATVVSLLISDVPGDEAGHIASAPTLPDETTCQQALSILNRYGVELTINNARALASGGLESPKPSDLRFAKQQHRIIASANDGLAAAAEAARARGWAVYVLSDAMQGEAKDMALAHAAIATHIQARAQPFKAPCIVLSGGEATVNVTGAGRGGRNTEFALALAIALQGRRGIYALSAGTDGLDGNGEAAGAWVTPQTLMAARGRGLDPLQHLLNNDSFTFFNASEATVVTGPTFTNINDFRAVLIEPV